jgi:hypothetical protein
MKALISFDKHIMLIRFVGGNGGFDQQILASGW